MLTALIAMSALLISIYEVMHRNVAETANTKINQELEEFRTFAAEGLNPETSEPFTSPKQLLEAYIARQYSSRTEQLVGIAGDSIIFTHNKGDHPTSKGYLLSQDQELIEELSNTSVTSGTYHTPAGPIHWVKASMQTSHHTTETGYLVVIEYVQPSYQAVNKTIGTMMSIAGMCLLAALGISWFVSGQIIKPICELRKVAEAINDKDITARVPVTGTGDVAAMSLTFNQMLDRLEEASTMQRNFLDDVSHELRTPITIVRGHLELMDRHTEDQQATLDLVDDELDRMGRIVSDLLLLAKSERPDFLHISPTDVADLMISLDSTVQTLGNNTWVISEIADGTVSLDQQRITQAMIQLCANAAQYSPAQSIITIGSTFTDYDGERHLDLWVRDRGPGINAEAAQTIFNRFQRRHR